MWVMIFFLIKALPNVTPNVNDVEAIILCRDVDYIVIIKLGLTLGMPGTVGDSWQTLER